MYPENPFFEILVRLMTLMMALAISFFCLSILLVGILNDEYHTYSDPSPEAIVLESYGFDEDGYIINDYLIKSSHMSYFNAEAFEENVFIGKELIVYTTYHNSYVMGLEDSDTTYMSWHELQNDDRLRLIWVYIVFIVSLAVNALFYFIAFYVEKEKIYIEPQLHG